MAKEKKKKRASEVALEKSNKEIDRIMAAKKARAEKKKAAPKKKAGSQTKKTGKASIPNFQGRTMSEVSEAASKAAERILGGRKKKETKAKPKPKPKPKPKAKAKKKKY